MQSAPCRGQHPEQISPRFVQILPCLRPGHGLLLTTGSEPVLSYSGPHLRMMGWIREIFFVAHSQGEVRCNCNCNNYLSRPAMSETVCAAAWHAAVSAGNAATSDANGRRECQTHMSGAHTVRHPCGRSA